MLLLLVRGLSLYKDKIEVFNLLIPVLDIITVIGMRNEVVEFLLLKIIKIRAIKGDFFMTKVVHVYLMFRSKVI